MKDTDVEKEWHDVNDDIPDLGLEVIVYSPTDGVYMASAFEARNNYVYFRASGYGSIIYDVTHWMHKPNPPEGIYGTN